MTRAQLALNATLRQQRTFSTSLRDLFPALSPVGNPQGRLLVLGAGWAGYQLVKNIDKANYQVELVAPKNYFTFTPLLASASVGTLELRSTVESARFRNVNFYEAQCNAVDLAAQSVRCVATSGSAKEFTLGYDKLVIACGAVSNTFNVPGVTENACFLKDVSDARAIRHRLLECFERASHPLVSDTERDRLLHFAVIGGGPTGVEFASELYDFITDDVHRQYPHLAPHIQLSIYDGAPRLLPTFEQQIGNYTVDLFRKRGIAVHTGKAVKRVEATHFHLNDGSVVPFGLLMWSTGVAPGELVKSMLLQRRPNSAASGSGGVELLAGDRMKRLTTDNQLRVLTADGTPLRNVYALGDCATIVDQDLPCTAQVARQKAEFLYKMLNRKAKGVESADAMRFRYKHRGSMAYVGGWRAVVDIDSAKKQAATGRLGWLVWRTAYLSMAESFRNKVQISTNWLLTWLTGREISRFQ